MDGIAFLMTVLRQIKFITAEHVTTCTAKSLSKHLAQVVQVYTRAGFSVRTILIDGSSEKLRQKFQTLYATQQPQRSMSERLSVPSAR